MNTNKYINTYTVFYLILLFQIIVDLFFTKETKDCIINKINFIDKLTLVLIILLHHFYSVFIVCGWILSSKWILILYILLNLITISSWKINNGLCYMTILQNKICNWKIIKSFNNVNDFIHKFIIKIFNMDETNYTYLYVYAIITSCIAAYKILYI